MAKKQIVTINYAIHEVMYESGILPSELARRVGISHQHLNGVINRPGMNIKSILKFIHAMGYKLEVKIGDYEYIIKDEKTKRS